MTYNDFINNILNTRGRFNIPITDYKERHHIIPRCIGGEDTEDNLIDLYPEEHFIAHKLLFLENQDNIKLASAWLMMAFPKNKNLKRNYEISPEDYKILRENAAKKIGKTNKGKKWTKEQRQKIKGRIPWNKGLTKENNEKIKIFANNLSKSLKKSGARKEEKNSQFGKIGRISGDKNPMKNKEAKEKVSNYMKNNNPMKNKEIREKVYQKTRGRHWYHNPNNPNERGQFFDGTQPEKWVRGMGKIK